MMRLLPFSIVMQLYAIKLKIDSTRSILPLSLKDYLGSFQSKQASTSSHMILGGGAERAIG